MNRLFVTGDMHCNACGEFSKLNTKNFPVQKELSKDCLLYTSPSPRD